MVSSSSSTSTISPTFASGFGAAQAARQVNPLLGCQPNTYVVSGHPTVAIWGA